jgi:outer membrane protein assembly factor BamA
MAILTAVVILAIYALVRQPASDAEAAPQAIPRLQEVRSISFDGDMLPLSRLREALATHTGDQLDTAQLDRDRVAIEGTLAQLGYLAARVSPAAVTFDTAGAAYVTFEVVTGQPFHLRNVEVLGPGKDTAVVTLSPGDLAVQRRIDQARQSLAEGLARRGKPASVELSVHTDLAAAAVDVTLSTR